jgi:hypothetical protein
VGGLEFSEFVKEFVEDLFLVVGGDAVLEFILD